MRSRVWMMMRSALPLIVVAAGVGVLFGFPPERSSLYPRCPVYWIFGVECPGCGGTRALSALLHGNVGEALRLNAMLVLALPFVAAYGVVCYRRFLRREKFRWPEMRPIAIYSGLAVAVVFMILRNLPLPQM